MNRRGRLAQRKNRRAHREAAATAGTQHLLAVTKGMRGRVESVGQAEVAFDHWIVTLCDPKQLTGTNFQTLCSDSHRHWSLSFTATTEKPNWASFGMILAAFDVPSHVLDGSHALQFQVANYDPAVGSPVHVVWTEPHDKNCAACQHAESVAVGLMARRLEFLSLPSITPPKNEHHQQSN